MQIKLLQVSVAGDREVNQDFMSYHLDDDFSLFVVADGLGGHHAGEKASQYFCQGMVRNVRNFSSRMAENPIETMAAWIDRAIDEMKQLFGNDPYAGKAHTTCAILYLDNKHVVTGHCGDSRVYRMNANEILWRTRDHSIPQDLLEAGFIDESEMAGHPEQNQLTRSININKVHPIDINAYPAMKEDETFLLCSDGFWEHTKESELLQLADKKSDSETLSKLIRLSVYRARGRSDNVTVQVVKVK